MQKNVLFFTCLMLILGINTTLMAQTRAVTGKVIADDGSALPGLNVLVKGTTIGTTTNVEGRYSISVPENSVLIFSFVGMNTKEVVVGSQSVIDVTMTSDAKALSEVVVTGYGVAQKAKDLTGSVSTVKGSTIENLPMQTFDRALQGRAAGVQITAASGAPGGAINVRIRGIGSINAGTSPLYIVDGVQVADGSLGSQASTNVLASINPNDIESIEVLKDAAASSIYGAQAANGVVVITTKKGKEGKTIFSLSAQHGKVEPIGVYDVLTASEFATLKIESYVNRAVRTGTDVAKARTDAIAAYGDPATVQNTDWQDAVYRTARIRSYDLSAKGGNDKTRFYVSGSYNFQEGQIIKSDFKRGTFRLNLEHKANDKLSFEAKINLASTVQNGAIADGAFINSPFFAAALILPNQPIYNEDGTLRRPTGTFSYNPVQNALYETRLTKTKQTVSSFAAVYQILPGLNFRSFYGIDYAVNNDENFRSPLSPNFSSTNGSGSNTNRSTLNWNTNQTLNWAHTFKDVHNVSGVVGAEFRQEIRESFTAAGNQFPANGLFTTLAAAATPTSATATYTTWKIGSFFGQAKYDYKDKYLFTATVRYDGSSKFGKNKRWGLFYAGSAGWRLSGEEFLKDVTFIDDLKIRASYGTSGNSQIDNFASRALYGLGGQYLSSPGIRPSQLGNDDLTWEEAKTVDLGLDYSFFNGRVYGSFDVYRKRNEKLLLQKQLPGDSGFESIMQNVGVVQNDGLEIQIGTVNINYNGFKWATDFNISFQRNKIVELNDGLKNIGTSYWVGQPVLINWLPTYAGVNPADGRAMWLDTLGNITYNPVARDSRIQGSPIPKSFGGLSNTFSYKGITLEIFFQGQFGNKALNNNGFFLENSASGGWNNISSQLERWQSPGDITSVPRPYEGGTEPGSANYAGIFSSKHIEDASYIRLKQLTVSYDFPVGLISKVRLSKVRLFVQGLNLVTWTKYKGLDPELVTTELGRYPQPRQYTAGLQVEF
ncbi:TonB-dependent receptor [Xanthocytophaga agilis]|uniref:TonB-dependent receptor n=1 Tax=Xanthocytophaga agilis TaxID=3048010 RepID=A0AAE3RAL0_9BACT|nr:TonB-dependent receptor [Xanthocytophaga agilis]MDJ1504424.1 TonB-dependent receptor [Xanthocytophaga agilis]